ncbi:hypothetical protein [Bacillus infantis]|uniref:Lipoprotein n=1 Tax=Bacillus infantis TaxID=324767 RepID=A0A5D4R8C0_9BACI|nr:hypothetical protein [Bacillus infantis]TYS45852.1 hypothetical protein FZD51_17540 [Bacillus infantis]
MNKKRLMLPVSLAFAISAAGCSGTDGAGSPAPEETQQDETAMPDDQNTETNADENEAEADGTEENSTEEENSHSGSTQTTDDVIGSVKEQLKMENAILPSSFSLKEGSHLSASIEEDKTDSYQVTFYQTNEVVPVNDPLLTPDGDAPVVAVFKAHIKTAADNDQELFPPMSVDDEIPAEMAIDLGHDIKGMGEGAAGHKYLSWKEGNWILQISSVSEDQMDDQAVARQMVDYLESHYLPAPHDDGRIKVHYRQGGNEVENDIYWEDGERIYELETKKVPLEALEMAVSTK